MATRSTVVADHWPRIRTMLGRSDMPASCRPRLRFTSMVSAASKHLCVSTPNRYAIKSLVKCCTFNGRDYATGFARGFDVRVRAARFLCGWSTIVQSGDMLGLSRLFRAVRQNYTQNHSSQAPAHVASCLRHLEDYSDMVLKRLFWQ